MYFQNRSHARTGSMPSESAIKLAVKRSEIKEEEKKSKTETPVVANCVPMRPSANLQNSLESPGKKPVCLLDIVVYLVRCHIKTLFL